MMKRDAVLNLLVCMDVLLYCWYGLWHAKKSCSHISM